MRVRTLPRFDFFLVVVGLSTTLVIEPLVEWSHSARGTSRGSTKLETRPLRGLLPLQSFAAFIRFSDRIGSAFARQADVERLTERCRDLEESNAELERQAKIAAAVRSQT